MFSYSLSKEDQRKIYIESFLADESSNDVTVPAKIDSKFVVGLTDSAFEGEDRFTGKVELSHGIEIIGKEAFKGCPTLEILILPSTITRIGAGAFSDCESLQEVRFLGDMPRVVADDIFEETPLVEVFHYATNRGWDGALFKGRPLRVIDEDVLSLGGEESDDDSRGEVVNMDEDEFGEKEARFFKEDNPEEDAGMWENEEVEYKAEMKAYERAGFMYVKPTSLKNVSKPEDAFRIRLTNAFDTRRALLKGLVQSDLQNMIDPIWLIQHIEFKNPVAYMLGYYVVENNRINEARLKIAVRALEEIAPHNEIAAVDILRYGFYWIEFLHPASKK